MKIDIKSHTVEVKVSDFKINSIFKLFKNRISKLIIIFAFFLSSLTLAINYINGWILSYNDAKAHMNMARLVIDNLKPGFAQLGSVWLPLPHLLTLTLVWNNWLWKTGLAGTIFSMLFFIASSYVLYKILKIVVSDLLSVLIGILIFVTNANILYMQATPMTELPLLFFSILGVYFLLKWVKERTIFDLLGLSASLFLASLTRYDGWFQIITTSLILGIVEFKRIKDKVKTKKIKNLIILVFKDKDFKGVLFFYATFAGLGVILWLLWNQLIFKNPLYFAVGPYSAKAQQQTIEAAGTLFTKGNLLLSTEAYLWSISDNIGALIFIVMVFGIIEYYVKNRLNSESLILLILFSPVVFHIASLFLGNSVLVVPEMKINVMEGLKGTLFNARYGLMMLPAAAVFSAYLATKGKFVKYLILFFAVFTPLMMIKDGYVIDFMDGQMGSSSLRVGDVSEWMKENAPDGLILTALSYNNAFSFSTGFPLKRFIHEGTGKYWTTSLQSPEKYADWIVMANGDVGDPVYTSLIDNQHSEYLKYYDLAKSFEFLNVYKRKTYPQGFVYVNESKFYLDKNEFNFIGANSYDLIYRSDAEIATTLSSAKDTGFKVIRFWVFGEGANNLIQPKPGVYNETLLKKVDYIIATADKLNIKVIPVLSDYWTNYGGVDQYLKWVDLPDLNAGDKDRFFTDDRTKLLYKNFADTIISRTNVYTSQKYSNDPAIFGWELMNEPRSSSTGTSNVVNSWFREMSNYIKSIDKYHMVLTGAEGYFDNLAINPYSTGPSINQIANLPTTDALSGHYYLKNYVSQKPVTEFDIVDNWTQLSRNANKPFYIEEIGFSKNSADNNGVDRVTLYKDLLKSAKNNNLQGLILWNWALKIDDNTGISPLDPNDAQLIQIFKNYSQELNQ